MGALWYCINCGTENNVFETIIEQKPFSKKCKCANCPAEVLIVNFNEIIRLPIRPDKKIWDEKLPYILSKKMKKAIRKEREKNLRKIKIP